DGGTGPSFRELVRRTRRTALGAFAHQDLPFERLVEEIRAPRRLDLSPIFQALFVFLNTPEVRLELADLTIEPVELPIVVAKFDLTLGFVDHGGRYTATLDYATDLFADETVIRWRSELVDLIRRVAAAPDEPVGHALPGPGPAARTRVPTAAETAPFAPPASPLERSVAGIWSEVLGVDPDRIGRGSSFFDLGGHSLLAVQLALSIERSFGVEISLRALFENPGLAAFVESLEAAGVDAERPTGSAGLEAPETSEGSERAIPRLAIRPDPLPLSFAQSRLWLLDRLEKSAGPSAAPDRKSTRLNSSHANISYAVFCLKKKKKMYYLSPTKKKKNKYAKKLY